MYLAGTEVRKFNLFNQISLYFSTARVSSHFLGYISESYLCCKITLSPFEKQNSSGSFILYYDLKVTSLETFQTDLEKFKTLGNSGSLLCGCQEVAGSNSQTRIEKLQFYSSKLVT